MSKWEQYRASTPNPSQSKWSQYKIDEPQTKKEYTYGNRAASLGKSAVAGAGGAILDTASLAYNLPAMGINKLREVAGRSPDRNLPLIPSATQAIGKGIDNLTDGYTETPEDQKWLNQGVEFATGVGGSGAIGKGAQALGMGRTATLANVAGTTNKSAIAGAGAAGATMSALEDQGASTGESLAAGLAAGIGVSNLKSLGQSAARGAGKAVVGATGLGKNKIDIDAAKAAKNLDIELPAATLSESNLTALADQWIGKTPFFGTKLQTKYKKAEGKAKEILDNIFEQTGPKKTPEIEAKISNLYQNRIDS